MTSSISLEQLNYIFAKPVFSAASTKREELQNLLKSLTHQFANSLHANPASCSSLQVKENFFLEFAQELGQVNHAATLA